MSDYLQIVLYPNIIIKNYKDEDGLYYMELTNGVYSLKYEYRKITSDEIGMLAVFYDKLKDKGYIAK